MKRFRSTIAVPACLLLLLLAGIVVVTDVLPSREPGAPDPAPEFAFPSEPETPPADAPTPTPSPPEATEDAGGRAPLRFRILDDEGVPLPNVRIDLHFSTTTSSGHPRYLGQGFVNTGPEGRGALDLPQSALCCKIRIQAPDGFTPPPRYEARLTDLLLMVPGKYGPTGVPVSGISIGWAEKSGAEPWTLPEIRLERANEIEGRVEGPDGTGLSGVPVTAIWPAIPAGERRLEVETEPSGRFVLPVPTRQEHVRVLVRVLVRPWAELGLGLAPREFRKVRPGMRGLEVRLARAVSLEVRPVGPEGKRLERGLLIARPLSVANFPVRKRECYPHPDGELPLLNLAAGTWVVEFQPGDLRYLPATATVQVPGPPLQLRCEPAGSLTGVVAGEDVDKFAVSWLGPGDRYRLAARQDRGIAESKLPGSPQVVRKNGRFCIEGLGKEPGALYVRRPCDRRCAYVEDVRAKDGDIEVTLHPGLSILGRVEGIEPWERRGVYLRASRDRIVQQARLQKDGTFEIAGLPPGRFHVEAFGIGILVDSRLAVQSDVQAGAEGVTLTVSR